MTVAQAKSKEKYHDLQKKYDVVMEQLEIIKRDTHIPQSPKAILTDKDDNVTTLYTGISLFHLFVSILISFFFGFIVSKYYH